MCGAVVCSCGSQATKLGMPVMAHAHAAEGIKIAVRFLRLLLVLLPLCD